MSNKTSAVRTGRALELNKIKISGIQLPIYLGIAAIVFITMYLGILPGGMIGAFAVMMVFGGLFNVIGNSLPIVKTYLGGGAIVCIFASAFLVYFGIIPQRVVENMNTFMNTTGFLNFYIAALITGSILGMNRKLLLKAAVRFLPVALCAMTFAILSVGIVGAVTGYGFADAIMYVAIPMMGIGISMIDLGAVISAFSPLYMLLVLVVVCVTIGGQLVGFYPVESAITAGLCTTNMDGTGDIAVLCAAKRMELLPFAQIATRICGALILIVASILTKVLL